MGELFRIGYFNWWLVAAYVVLVGVFLYGILKPRQKSEWKSAGVAQAWVIALYAEMYGLPLSAYFVMNWLGHSQADAEKHLNGHLWPVMMGLEGETLVYAQAWFTVIGQLLILIGGVLAIVGWRQLYLAVKEKRMADRGLYKYVRHPQYTGFFLFLLGSVVNWPTIPTLLTLPILLYVYWRLASQEEADSIEIFGDEYRAYMRSTGRFIPGIGKAATI